MRRTSTGPDARRYAAPDTVRDLVDRTGLPRQEVADRLGVSLRTLERHIAGVTSSYPVQYALEAIVVHG